MEDNRSRFSGDMDRNEVEMDLNKFMAMIEEISQLKDKIRDLEDDTIKNPHQRWIHLAKAVDSWRIFPELFLRFTSYFFTNAPYGLWSCQNQHLNNLDLFL